VHLRAELIGGGAAERGAVGGKMALPGLNAVRGLAQPKIQVFVNCSRRSGGEVDDYEARVGSMEFGLDAGNDPLEAASTRGAVMDFLPAPPIVAALRVPVATSWRE
jgi:hypothetical protein